MPKRTRDYHAWLMNELTDSRAAASYVNAAIDEDSDLLPVVLREVAKAYTMKKVAEDAGVARESLYTSLSEAGNPTLTNLNSILKAVGLKIAVVPDSEESCVQETPPELAVADQLHIDSNARKAIEGLTKAANINVAIPNVMGFFGVEPHPGLGYFNFKLQAGLGAYTREPLTMKATWSVFGNAVEKEIQNQSGVTDSCKTALAQMETFTGKVTRPAGISVQQPTL